MFKDTGITITVDGHCALVTPIGTDEYIETWCLDKVRS